MTAIVRHLFPDRVAPAQERLLLRCPHCAARTPLVEPTDAGKAFTTPLGIRRFRACLACGRPFTTVESVSLHLHEAALAIPGSTPVWVQSVLEWIARAAARVGSWR